MPQIALTTETEAAHQRLKLRAAIAGALRAVGDKRIANHQGRRRDGANDDRDEQGILAEHSHGAYPSAHRLLFRLDDFVQAVGRGRFERLAAAAGPADFDAFDPITVAQAKVQRLG